MKFLADMGISLITVRAIREKGYEINHLSELGLGRLPDIEILQKAQEEGLIILTFDLDFGDLLVTNLVSLPSVIIFRVKQTTPHTVTTRFFSVLNSCKDSLQKGSLIIVEEKRYRLRHLPLKIDK